MSVAEQIGEQLPYLRRYARALTGSQHSGDAFVRATLEAALADRALLDQISKGRAALYGAFNRIWSSGHVEAEAVDAAGGLHEQAAQLRLSHITPEHRQALLLTTLEDFSREDTASILGVSPNEVDALVRQAIDEIENETTTDVLIIEDEPLIAMQLEDLVTSLGHTVSGTAATRTQARAAVDDILSVGSMPVIFITAYPERLLTGDRPEPTYLVTKPFHEATVRAAIGQALFFGSSRPLGS